jgi:hypothetical protein
VRHAAHGDFESAIHFYHYRNVFFCGRFHRVLLEEIHRLIAARELPSTFVDHLNDVSAHPALVNL